MKAKVMSCNKDFQEEVEQFLDDLISGVDTDHYFDEIEVRFIKADGTFGYGSVFDLFFYHDQLYFWTQNKRAKDYMRLSDFELFGRLQYLETFVDVKIYPVIFAGFYTGYRDCKEQKIYTGDVVKATILHNYNTIAGVNSFVDYHDDYYYILDNSPIAMQNTRKAKVIGNVFYDLDRDNLSVNIAERCAMLAFPYKINLRNLHIKMAHAPYFVCKTWQEKALKILKDEQIYEDLPITTT